MPPAVGIDTIARRHAETREVVVRMVTILPDPSGACSIVELVDPADPAWGPETIGADLAASAGDRWLAALIHPTRAFPRGRWSLVSKVDPEASR